MIWLPLSVMALSLGFVAGWWIRGMLVKDDDAFKAEIREFIRMTLAEKE